MYTLFIFFNNTLYKSVLILEANFEPETYTSCIDFMQTVSLLQQLNYKTISVYNSFVTFCKYIYEVVYNI